MLRRLFGHSRVALILLVLALITALANAPTRAPRARAATGTAPIVVRDVEAGGDVLTKHKTTGCSNLTCEQPDTAIEPSIAVNPTNPLNAVAVYQIGRVDAGGDADNGFASTFDGGQTWISGYLPGLTRSWGGTFDRASDAVVAFGPDGTVYANSLVFDDVTNQGLRSGMAVNVSKDGGRTWGAPVLLQDDQGAGLNDKNWIVVDQSSAPGHHKGRVYVVWDRVAPVIVNYSDDQGKTWLPLFSVVYPGQGIGAVPIVLNDGSLAIVFATTAYPLVALHPTPTDDVGDHALPPGNGYLVMAIAEKAGMLPTGAPLVFTPPVTIAEYQAKAVRDQRAATIPTADIDTKTGRIYVSWEDARFRTDPANDIVVVSSTDGIQWTKPVKVNTGGAADQVNHWNSAIAVGPDGSVRVAYRQRQEAAAVKDFSPFIDTYFQQSTDEGKTWTPPLKVNSLRTNVAFAAISRDGAFLGDYQQIAAAGPITYVVRNEAYPPRPGVSAVWDKKLNHAHQTTWVAVVGTESTASPSAAAAPAKQAAAQVQAARTGRLPATGRRTTATPAFLVAAALFVAWIGRRPRRQRI
jgi:hypothetical protein